MSHVDSEADQIIARLASMHHARPVVDRPMVEEALAEHFRRLGLTPLPVRWIRDAEEACMAAVSAAERARRNVARHRGRRGVWPWNRLTVESETGPAMEIAAVDAAWRAFESSAESAAGRVGERRPGIQSWIAAWRAAESAVVGAWPWAGSAAWRMASQAAVNAADCALWAAVFGAAWRSTSSAAVNAGLRTNLQFREGVAYDLEAETATRPAPWRMAQSAPWRVVWNSPLCAGESAAWHAAVCTAWRAAWRAAVNAALKRDIAIPSEIDQWIRSWLPFLNACEAGLWLFWVLERDVLAIPRPALRVVGDRLHCADGPAVSWPGGARYYFWRGVRVPETVILRPLDLTAKVITGEPNAEVRRVMLERYGPARYLQDVGAACTDRDETGELYRADIFFNDEPLVMVRVLNSTPEPDGSRKAYWLRVPPSMRTAHEAVAWTFGLSPETYRPMVET